jgi:hypothetical protein
MAAPLGAAPSWDEAVPTLDTWTLLGWTSRGDVVVVEWESSNRYGDRIVTWRGVTR